jgi:transcriptional regulator NrdR family protein
MDTQQYGVDEPIIMRRRKCLDCDYRFVTFEIPSDWFLDLINEVYGEEEGEES